MQLNNLNILILIMDNKPKVILVIAAPGAGKSTQCKLLASNLNLVHLSIG